MPTVAQRPENLIYAVDEWPPLAKLVFLGLQQASLVSIFLVFLVLVVREAGASHQIALSTLSFAMVALGLGAVLQGWWKGPIGSGYLAPPVMSAIYLPVALLAAKEGGLPLVFGMTMVAGAFECLLSRFLLRLQSCTHRHLQQPIFWFPGGQAGEQSSTCVDRYHKSASGLSMGRSCMRQHPLPKIQSLVCKLTKSVRLHPQMLSTTQHHL